MREMEMRQKVFAEEKDGRNQGENKRRQVSKISREEMIKKVKREKSKLE